MNGWPVDLALLAARAWPVSRERLGLSTPPVQPGSVWIHGASLGECRTARRLASALERPAFVTADTAAGAAFADALRPLDHPWALAPLWAESRPAMLVFVESGWYPGIVALARRDGVPVVSIAARPGRGASLRARALGLPDAVLARDDAAAAWFGARGVRVLGVCGTLKGGPPGAPSPLTWDGPFIAGVSTRPGDEAALIRARDTSFPEARLLLAPRHLERLAEVRALLPDASLRSETTHATGDVLVDTVGELDRLLTGAAVAFIGGTYDEAIGGHSPAEARWAGVSVVHGPVVRNNAADFEGAFLAATPDDLPEALRRAWDQGASPPADRLAETARVLDDLAVTPAPERSPRPWAKALQPVQRAGMRWRRAGRAVSLDVPVIAVGSANARGSGKTSTALWLADRLAEAGHDVGIATRGTGRTHRDPGLSHVHGADAAWLGDEGALFALRGHRVAAHADRLRAARALWGASVVVLEDGLQTGSIRADLRIAAVDARFPGARGLLPAGEGRGSLAPADLTLVHHAGSARRVGLAVPAGLEAHRTPGPWSPTAPSGPVYAFAGIGRNADFFADLDTRAVCGFQDHHTYTEQDLETLRCWASDGTLVTTDRDAVRIPAAWREALGLRWRGVTLEVPGFPLERLPCP
ncbi:MAG: tetraacyldisaccharide 4'-kinase [Alphaproteobacteria bacterium]|nr:tetraacyldisaccharide 4'-kinase [Alphaproteobacteria bacterium]